MRWHPYSLAQAPATLPPWQLLITELGHPRAAELAKLLGVGERSIYRWNKAGAAPRSACLALFWLTRWGRSQVNVQGVNDAALAAGYANALEAELRRTEEKLRIALALNATGAANEPVEAFHARR